MAGNHRTEWTAQLRDVDDSSRVAGRFLRHDGTRFVGDANVASATSLAARDAAIAALAAGLTAETSARQAADTALTTAVAGKAPLVHTHTTSQIDDLGSWPGSTALVTLGTVATGTWHGSVIGPAYLGTGMRDGTKYLRDDGTWQAVAGGGADLAIGATVTGGTGGRLLFEGAGPVLADSDNLTFADGSLTVRGADVFIPIQVIRNYTGTVMGRWEWDGSLSVGLNGWTRKITFGTHAIEYSGAYDGFYFADKIIVAGGLYDTSNSEFIRSGITGAVVTGSPNSTPGLNGVAINTIAMHPSHRLLNVQDTGADRFRFGRNGDLTALLPSSTGSDRSVSVISSSWHADTDALRLGELVLSSSGYNGDHVGLRVRDTGSAAQVILEGATAGSVLTIGPGGVLTQRFRTDDRHVLIDNTGEDASGIQFNSLGSVPGTTVYGYEIRHDRRASVDDLSISAYNAGGEAILFYCQSRGSWIGIGGLPSNLGYVTINPRPGAPTLPTLVIGTNTAQQAPAARYIGYSSDDFDGGGGIEVGDGHTVYCRLFRTGGNDFKLTASSPAAGNLDVAPKGRFGLKAPLVYLADSSTQERQAGLIDRSWYVNTDASRLGELVLSSSGYNGDHVGLRVRDNGSGADLIADGIREAADDTVAAALSPPVPLNAVYRTAAGFLKVRLT